MAPTPQNNTDRLFIDYVTGNLSTSLEHSACVRWDSTTTTLANTFLQVQTLLGAITAAKLAAGWRVLRARYGQKGTAFTLPVPVPSALAAIVGTGATLVPSNEAREWVWAGRSKTTGKGASFVLYGISEATPDNFRYPVGGTTPAWVGNSVNTLNANSASTFIVIDGTATQWYSYLNVNYNSYWETRIRTA